MEVSPRAGANSVSQLNIVTRFAQFRRGYKFDSHRLGALHRSKDKRRVATRPKIPV